MAQKLLSISLGSEIVKVCEVASAGKKKVQIYNAIDLVVPEGLLDDGAILDVDRLAMAITDGLKGEGFTSKKIVFAISSKRIANKEAIIPFCKEKMIADVVRINSSEYFPIPNLEDYVINYSILDVIKNDTVKNYRLSVVATPKDLINDYYELAKKMGMTVAYIDYMGNSMLQMLKLQTAGDGIDAILQMTAEHTIVNIMDGATLVMQRSVPYGRSAVLEAVMDARSVPASVADLMLIEEDIEDMSNSHPDIADAVRSLFSSINRILEFYVSRNPEKPIEHVYMIGDVVSINGLVELFDQEWDYDVSLFGSLKGIEIKNHKHVNFEIAANYLSNIGALLAPMNIAIEDGKNARAGRGGLPWWLLIFSAIIAAVMVGAVLYIYSTEKETNDSIRKQIESYGDVENLKSEYESIRYELTTLEGWYDTTKNSNETFARFINALEEIQPTSVEISRIAASNGMVTIDGYGYGKAALAEFVKQLKSIIFVKNVHLEYINESMEQGYAKDSFVLTLELIYDDPKSDKLSDNAEELTDELLNEALKEEITVDYGTDRGGSEQ